MIGCISLVKNFHSEDAKIFFHDLTLLPIHFSHIRPCSYWGSQSSCRLDWSHHSEAITLFLVFLTHLFHACLKSGKNILMGWRNKEAAISLPYSLASGDVESMMWWLEPDLTLAMGIAADPNLIKKDLE